MLDERTYYESVRRKANRARERLAVTLQQSRIATASDKERGSFVTRPGERAATRFDKRDARRNG